MAHGLESRLPYLDHPVVELAATMPPAVKFEGGQMKRVLVSALGDTVPAPIAQRRDKMGFPTPFNDWARGPANDFVMEIMSSARALSRELIDNREVLTRAASSSSFDREFWGFFSLELWQRQYHDRAADFRALATRPALVRAAGEP